MSEAICYGCLTGLHEECNEPELIEEETNPEDSVLYYSCCCWREVREGFPGAPVQQETGAERPRPEKSNDAIRDQQSTGRKRAVVAVKSAGRFVDGMVCEWAGLRFAGGGAVPMVGCDGYILRAVKEKSDLGPHESRINVHHGPDKSTLNNEQENLHVICDTCHNRWHGLNDKFYAKERPEAGQPFVPLDRECIPHDPETQASELAKKHNEAYWSLAPKVRPKVPYIIPEEGEEDG